MSRRFWEWLKRTFWPVGEVGKLHRQLSRVEEGMKNMAERL